MELPVDFLSLGRESVNDASQIDMTHNLMTTNLKTVDVTFLIREGMGGPINNASQMV